MNLDTHVERLYFNIIIFLFKSVEAVKLFWR